jgi:hypothetical protein
MDVADIPTKQDATRTGLLKRVFDPKRDWNAAEFNAIRDAILALRGDTTDLIDIRDDFTTTVGWSKTLANSGTAQVGDTATPAGIPSCGIFALGCTVDSGSKATVNRSQLGLILDDAKPIVIEFGGVGIKTGDASAFSDDACSWALAAGSLNLGNAVGFSGQLSGATRIYRLITVIDESITAEDIGALPAGNYHGIRLTITKDFGTRVEVKTTTGAWVTLGTGATSPPLTIYHPAMQISKDAGAGDRILIADYMRMRGYASAAAFGSATPTLVSFP